MLITDLLSQKSFIGPSHPINLQAFYDIIQPKQITNTCAIAKKSVTALDIAKIF